MNRFITTASLLLALVFVAAASLATQHEAGCTARYRAEQIPGLLMIWATSRTNQATR